jgi:hypothetical protein
MADIRATKNGDWSDATVWAPNPPAAGDVVRPNNFTVTIDVNVTVLEIRNDAGGGAVQGGIFVLNDNTIVSSTNGFIGAYGSNTNGLLTYGGAGSVTLNGKVEGCKSSVTSVCAISNTSIGTIIINGNIDSTGAGSGSFCLRTSGSGTFIITGNILGNGGVTSNANNAGTMIINGNVTALVGQAITNTSGTVTITGDLTNASGGNTQCVFQSGSGTINVIGNLQSVPAGNNINNNSVIFNSGNGTVNVTGNLTSGTVNSAGSISLSACINNTGNGTVNVTGTVTNGSSQLGSTILTFLQAIRNASTGIVNIIGNCIGTIAASPSHQSAAVINFAGGVVNVTGNAIGGSTGNAIQNIATGTINLNGNAIGGTAYAAVENTLSSGNLIVEKIVFGANGQTATRGYIKFKNISTMAAETVLKTDATTTNLVDINVVPNLQPAISDVRLGVTYSSGSLTGTMNVPPFNAVKAGVPVDNGVGTAYLDAADLWNFMISGITQSGSIGERLKIVSTIETTGTQLASFNV